MVATPGDPHEIRHYPLRQNQQPTTHHGRVTRSVWFTEELGKQIYDEAKRRNISFAAMVRHLCEASIDGIE